MDNDYRCTEYCPPFEKISTLKAELMVEIRKKHPRAKDIYPIVSPQDSEYKVKFMEIYHDKCSYCGVSMDIIPRSMFEIDHFYYKKSKRFNSVADAGYIDNLTLSCRFCNRKKHDLDITDEGKKDLYTDDNSICNSFQRNENSYAIEVSQSCSGNKDVLEFYHKLKLEDQLRKIDYTLMKAIGLQRKLRDSANPGTKDAYIKLSAIIEKIRLKRHQIG